MKDSLSLEAKFFAIKFLEQTFLNIDVSRRTYIWWIQIAVTNYPFIFKIAYLSVGLWKKRLKKKKEKKPVSSSSSRANLMSHRSHPWCVLMLATVVIKWGWWPRVQIPSHQKGGRGISLQIVGERWNVAWYHDAW